MKEKKRNWRCMHCRRQRRERTEEHREGQEVKESFDFQDKELFWILYCTGNQSRDSRNGITWSGRRKWFFILTTSRAILGRTTQENSTGIILL